MFIANICTATASNHTYTCTDMSFVLIFTYHIIGMNKHVYHDVELFKILLSLRLMIFMLTRFTFFFSTAARLYPTRQASVPQPQTGGGGAFSGGVSGSSSSGGGGFSSRTGFLRRSNNSKTTKSSSTSTSAVYQQSANFANYQNCTIVRSHTPHGNYGYVKVAPKILIFPIFVQVSQHTVCVCVSVSSCHCWWFYGKG